MYLGRRSEMSSSPFRCRASRFCTCCAWTGLELASEAHVRTPDGAAGSAQLSGGNSIQQKPAFCFGGGGKAPDAAPAPRPALPGPRERHPARAECTWGRVLGAGAGRVRFWDYSTTMPTPESAALCRR